MAWNFWPECPRLREYAFILRNYFRHTAPYFHAIDVLVELLSRPTVACSELQKLKIGITDYRGYEESCRHSCGPVVVQTRHCYEHQEHFLRLIRPFLRCLRSFRRLRQHNVSIRWDLCISMFCGLTLDDALLRINRPPTTTVDGCAAELFKDNTSNGNGSSSSRSETEATPLQSKEPEFTRQDLRWLGFHQRWHSGEDKQLRAEANAHVEKLRRVKEDTQDENAGTAWARSHRRVGCNWKDWEGLAGLYGCVPTRCGRTRDEYGMDCAHAHCLNDMPYGVDDGLDRFLSGHDIKVERGHRRRSMQRCRRKIIN